MREADLGKTGGILAFVAGIAQMAIGFFFASAGSVTRSVTDTFGVIGRIFGMEGGGGIGGPSFVWGLLCAYATLVVGALMISGAKGKVPGVALIVCAILGAFGGSAFALLAILSLTGGIIALIGGFGAGGDGLRGLMATAQRMAEAAKETDTADTKDAKAADETKETDETDEKKS